MFNELNARAEIVLKTIINGYLETGQPIGSRTLSETLPVSPATIRSVMADLTDMGLIYAPHTSAGRLPTESGLRLFVDMFMEFHDLSPNERAHIDSLKNESDKTVDRVFEKASSMMSGLSSCATIIAAPKINKRIQSIHFTSIAEGRILVILVYDNGSVENRLIETVTDLPPTSLQKASNYLTDRLVGRTLSEADHIIAHDIATRKKELDDLTNSLIEQGVTVSQNPNDGYYVVSGYSNLLADNRVDNELEKMRRLFAELEQRETMSKWLNAAGNADGIQIFIGAENKTFDHHGLSTVLAPFRDKNNAVVGAVGVIGPTYLNYRRIVPIVDYTSKVVTDLIR